MFRSVFKSGIRAAYNVLDNPTFVCEPWTVYPAKHRTSGRVVSVLIFDKTRFESQVQQLCSNLSNSKNPKVIISETYELIKFSINQLSKLRHPQVLTIYEVLEETKTKFLFVSESITDTLATLDIEKLDEITIQSGILQVAKGLQFLHNNGNIIHLNLQPNSIFINLDGDWKLAGFQFLQNMNEISPSERSNFYIMTQSIVPFANLNLNYTAPELIIDSTTQLDFGNDIWSLGCLIYYLFNHENMINCFDTNSISDYKREFQRFNQKFYNHRLNDLKYLLKDIPQSLYPIFQQTLSRYPHDRITISQFIDSDYFNGSVIKAMWFIDEFSTKSIDEKIIFIQKLAESEDLINQFPIKFKTNKLLHLLIDVITNELNVLTNPINSSVDQLISYSLTSIFKIGSSLSSLSFYDRIFEVLLKDNQKKKSKNYTNLINSSVKTRLTIVENLDIIQSKVNDREFVDFIKNSTDIFLTSSSSEATDQQVQIKLQELFLIKIPTFIDKIEFPYIKNTLFPLLCLIFKSTTILSTKLTTIEVFERLVNQNVIDKVIIVDQLLPILKNLKSRDKRVVTNVLKFFVQLCNNDRISLDLESLIDTILPQCFSLSFGCQDCSKSEFSQFMTLIKSIETKLIEKKLSTLNTGPANNNFDGLINTQKLNETKEQNIKTGVLQPTRNGRTSTQNASLSSNHGFNRGSDDVSSQSILKPTNEVRNGVHSMEGKPMSIQPTTKPLALKPKKTPLVFGATLQTQQEKNSKLLSTLNGSKFDKKEDEGEDEFQDFQTAKIDWNIEVQKKIDIPLYDSTLNSHKSTWKPSQPPSQPATQSPNFPPGFSANLVLTPNSTGSNNNSSSYSKNNTHTHSNNELDLL